MLKICTKTGETLKEVLSLKRDLKIPKQNLKKGLRPELTKQIWLLGENYYTKH